jgi:DNA-binding transcriptional LysR family regulator
LNEFAAAHPEIQLQVRVAGSQELLEALKAEQLDVVLCVRPAGEPQALKTAPMKWIGQPHLLDQDTLPLAMLEEPCMFRATALRALEDAGRKFRIVVETASLSVVRAAVQSGLGITCRNPLFIQSEPLPILAGKTLPPLPAAAYALFRQPNASLAAQHLASVVEDNVAGLERGFAPHDEAGIYKPRILSVVR